MEHLEPRAAFEFLQQHPAVLFIDCRSGNRSGDAGLALEAAGFTRVINVLQGFAGELDEQHQRDMKTGWRHDGLPREQS